MLAALFVFYHFTCLLILYCVERTKKEDLDISNLLPNAGRFIPHWKKNTAAPLFPRVFKIYSILQNFQCGT